jgi:NADPH:quinone reductase-like Zn-dependent oxidoreductase
MAVEERPDPVPAKHEVVVQTQFAGVNPADVLQREGRHPVPPGAPADIPGLEVAGTVVACGEAVADHQVGDRVFGLVGGGGLSNLVVAREREMVPVPEALDDRLAAAVPEAFITAYDAICLQAGLSSGDTLLVNGANGGVGTAAIQIARALGAKVIAGVRAEPLRAKVEALGATVLEPAEAAASARSAGGADVILELVGAPHMAANVEALARGGTIVIVGAGPGDEATLTLRDLMVRRGRIVGTTLRTRPPEEKGLLTQLFARRIVPFLAAGSIAPLVDRVFDLADARDALDHVRAPGKLGKVLLAT